MSRYIYSFILVVLFNNVFAQEALHNQKINSQITGKVIDSSGQKPIEYATITVADQQSKKIISRGTSDASGSFLITGISAGTYTVVAEFIGYQSKKIENIIIYDERSSVSLNVISLTPSSNMLTSVTVTTKAPIVENKIDKIIYNVANDVTSQGGVALDVLKKVPQIAIDIDGNIELQGDANIRFLINGKPSSVFGNSLTDALSSIPASQIKSIEVITNPGAKYDAQGTGGIINIILKDNKMQGFNGSINCSVGTRLENSSVNLNVRHNNFGVNIFFNGNAQLSSRTPNSQNRLSMDTIEQTSTNLLQNGYTDFKRNGYQSGIGFDWNITKKNIITVSLGYSHFDNNSSSVINEEQITKDVNNILLSDIFSLRNSDSRSRINSIDYSLDYKKKFKKEGEELEILYNASLGKPSSSYIQTQTYQDQTASYIGSTSNNPGTDNENDISIDYSYPVNKSLLLETGVKTTFENINSVADVEVLDTSTSKYLPDSTQSYNLNYKTRIYAGYVSTSFSLFKYLDVKVGMRYEYTDASIDFPNTSVPSYKSFVPSFTLSHHFNKNNFLKFAYSHRIERPNYNELNPFINLSDPYNITKGNPLLQPEIGNNFELGYNKTLDNGGNIYVALIERINTDDIKPYTFFYTTYQIGDSTYNNVSVTTRENTGTEYNSGIMVSGSLPINKLSLRSNLQLIQQRNIDNLEQGNITIGYKFRINLNAAYQFPHNLTLELFGNYNSAVNSVQGKMPQLATYTFAFRKQFWNKKASIGFTATNPFNKYISQVTTLSTVNYSSYSTREVPYRSFGISFSYKFGKLEFKKVKEDDNNYLNDLPN